MKTQQSVVRTVAAVLVAFVFCWLPFFVVYSLQAYDICSVNTSLPRVTRGSNFGL